MTRFTSVMKLPKKSMLIGIAVIMVFCIVASASAAASGGPGGMWPKSWPQQLEPLRKQSWTWVGGLVLSTSFEIPFDNREEFESAWPHILKLKSKNAPITLSRGAHIHVKTAQTAGVKIAATGDAWARHKKVATGQIPPGTVTSITLVVDGNIVDLNRIRLPADTRIIDKRFPDTKGK